MMVFIEIQSNLGRNFIERIKAPIFLDAVLAIETIQEPQSNFSPLNLRRHLANAVVVLSRFFLTTAKFCRRDNFDITLVKVIVTPTNIFTLFQALSLRHSRSLVTSFTLAILQTSRNGFK